MGTHYCQVEVQMLMVCLGRRQSGRTMQLSRNANSVSSVYFNMAVGNEKINSLSMLQSKEFGKLDQQYIK